MPYAGGARPNPLRWLSSERVRTKKPPDRWARARRRRPSHPAPTGGCLFVYAAVEHHPVERIGSRRVEPDGRAVLSSCLVTLDCTAGQAHRPRRLVRLALSASLLTIAVGLSTRATSAFPLHSAIRAAEPGCLDFGHDRCAFGMSLCHTRRTRPAHRRTK
jgi:hypothetical protein